jgi:hypothetical protein
MSRGSRAITAGGPNLSDSGDGIGRTKDGVACDETPGTCGYARHDRLGVDAAVDLDRGNRHSELVAETHHLARLVYDARDERLAAKSRVDAHQQHHVDVAENVA